MSDDILEIVLRYKQLAKSMSGRVILFKDKTMLPFLAYSISSEAANVKVIEPAIETLFHFSNHNSNVSQMKETYGVFEALNFVNNRDDLPSHLKEKVTLLLKRIEQIRDFPAYCTRSKTKALAGNERNTQAKTSKLIKLHVHGMTKDCRRELETAIIAVHGVVSVVLDVDHQCCCLRVYDMLTPLDIATAIYEQTGLEAKLVSRNRLGQEILQPLLKSSSNDFNDREDWPSYLQEEDSPVKKEAVSKRFSIKDRPGHWLSSAMGFIQKSFYW